MLQSGNHQLLATSTVLSIIEKLPGYIASDCSEESSDFKLAGHIMLGEIPIDIIRVKDCNPLDENSKLFCIKLVSGEFFAGEHHDKNRLFEEL